MANPEKQQKRLSSLLNLIDTSSKLEKPPPRNHITVPSPSQSPLLSPQYPDSRPPSSRGNSRPSSPFQSLSASRGSSPARNDKRRSWLPSSRNTSEDEKEGPRYWLVKSGSKREPYDPQVLASSVTLPELWDEHGDTLVFLSPQAANKPPSFKVQSSIFAASQPLVFEAHGSKLAINRHVSVETSISSSSLQAPSSASSVGSSRSAGSSAPRSASGPDLRTELRSKLQASPLKLYFPALAASSMQATPDEIEAVLSVRNFFAFLTGQPLVASPKRPSNMQVFRDIAAYLTRHEFTNLSGSTFGEAASSNMSHCIEQLRLRDVRKSAFKTVEGLVIGEQMKSVDLYNEAFVHGVGRWEELLALPEALFHQITRVTRNRMERASMDLETRLKSVRGRLTDFDFPSLFVGFANSQQVKAWKTSFLALRKHVLGFYKEQYGSWPPKMSVRNSNQSQGAGLNRVVLQLLYRDLSELYDLLVDRTALTTRSLALPSQSAASAHLPPTSDDLTPRTLRRVMSEYDRSSPPVQPPVPYDTPLLPSSKSTPTPLSPSTKLKGADLATILTTLHNPDSLKHTLFLTSFLNFERRSAHGATLSTLTDQRIGHWIFLYAVLQTLPLLVIDAPDLHFTQGVEYFLCEPPKGGAPWALSTDSSRNKSWYGIAGSTGVVSLPSDVVDHGVEGIYRRSHCWQMAERWSSPAVVDALEPDSPLEPPPALSSSGYYSAPGSASSSRASSPDGRGRPVYGRARDSWRHSQQHGQYHRHSAVFLGLEALPLPEGVGLDDGMSVGSGGSRGGQGGGGGQRRAASLDPTRRFEDILADVPGRTQEKKKKKKKKKNGKA